VGIGWAVSLSSLVQLCLLWHRLGKRSGPLPAGEILHSLGLTLAAALIAAAAGRLTSYGLAQALAGQAFAGLVGGLVSIAVFVVVFFLSALQLGCQELQELATPFRRLLGRLRSPR